MALSSCPECRKEISDTARNCPHCGWHKSQIGVLAAWIILVVILAIAALFYYQIDPANNAEANLKKELDKSDAMIKALKP
jgi:RNA polymerase subunit RPABC4/transcription elongation factor Spt4